MRNWKIITTPTVSLSSSPPHFHIYLCMIQFYKNSLFVFFYFFGILNIYILSWLNCNSTTPPPLPSDRQPNQKYSSPATTPSLLLPINLLYCRNQTVLLADGGINNLLIHLYWLVHSPDPSSPINNTQPLGDDHCLHYPSLSLNSQHNLIPFESLNKKLSGQENGRQSEEHLNQEAWRRGYLSALRSGAVLRKWRRFREGESANT